MPMISMDAIFKTIAEQDAQIKALKHQIAVLESMLENQSRIKRAQELVAFVRDYPDKLHYPIVASTERH